MAILIPPDMTTSGSAGVADAQVAQALQAAMPSDVWVWYHPKNSSQRPRFVAITSQFGIVAIDVYDWTCDAVQEVRRDGVRLKHGDFVNPAGELNPRLEQLRARLPETNNALLQGLIALPNITDADVRAHRLTTAIPRHCLVTRDQLGDMRLTQDLEPCPTPLNADLLQQLRDRLYPETSFQRPKLVRDEARAQRKSIRVRLTAEQEGIARTLSSGVTIVKGVAGSGKSLILAARARYLAAMHPDWRIQVLCFNRTLVKYLKDLVGTPGGCVNVSTFHRWALDLGVQVPWIKTPADEQREEETIRRFVDAGSYKHSYDAILVDEGQDFRQSWFAMVGHMARPQRGGVMVVTDGAQSIYQEASLGDLLGTNASTLFLTKNFRNTEQIGRFAVGTIFTEESDDPSDVADSRTPFAGEFSLQGQPVQVVSAPTRDEQAEFIAKEIRRLVREGFAGNRDIAVLVTTWWGAWNRLKECLSKANIRHFVLDKNPVAKNNFDLTEQTVKVLTAHSAKGLEFPVVFMFGVDGVKLPPTMRDADQRQANLARALYVGMTRATDLLYVTYKDECVVSRRASSLSRWCDIRQYPGDFDYS